MSQNPPDQNPGYSQVPPQSMGSASFGAPPAAGVPVGGQPAPPPASGYAVPQGPPPPGQYAPQQGAPQQYGYGAPQPQQVGFFKTLFDLTFSHYLSLTFAKVVFIFAVVLAALGWVFSIIAGFGVGQGTYFYDGTVIFGVMAILFGWIPGFLSIVWVRVILEFAMSSVKTAENTSIIAQKP